MKIVSRDVDFLYITFTIETNGKTIKIKVTQHALQRAKLWQVTEIELIKTLIFPDEVIMGHSNRFIAHKVKNSKIIRVVYEYRDKIPYVITVYAPSKERYFQGGNIYADKILP